MTSKYLACGSGAYFGVQHKKAKGIIQEKGHNQDQAGLLDEGAGQRGLDDFGKKRQKVEFVGEVHSR